MTSREIAMEAIEFRPVPYVPWSWVGTQGCCERLLRHLGVDDLEPFLRPHFATVGSELSRFTLVGEGLVRDVYGVTWDRSVDRDIGTPCDWPLRRPEDLAAYEWPDANDDAWYGPMADIVAANAERFSLYMLGFSLYERAWTMRGMTDLLMDMVERPEFVEELLDAIVAHDLAQVHRALAAGVDGVYFGDDYGMQTGLIFGIENWRRFIKPRLAKLFAPVRDAGKYVYMHSCGKVDALFDDLVEIGLNVFNPFQPEAMDVFDLIPRYHGRLAFHGGMSIQKTLPFGTPDEVREATQRLIDAGRDGGLIFSPSHAVPPDVPPENLVAMMDVLTAQDGYSG